MATPRSRRLACFVVELQLPDVPVPVIEVLAHALDLATASASSMFGIRGSGTVPIL